MSTIDDLVRNGMSYADALAAVGGGGVGPFGTQTPTNAINGSPSISGGIANYSTDTSGNVTGLVGPSGQTIAIAPTLTWAQVQALATPYAGQRVIASDLNYAELVYNGTIWSCPHPIRLLNFGAPLVFPSSGTMGNNGALTLTTTISELANLGCYMYFPAGAIATGIPAAGGALYWVVMNGTGSGGTVYNNTLILGQAPFIPSTLNAFVTTGPGAYAQTTSADFIIGSFTIPGGLMGPSGFLRTYYRASVPNNANVKFVKSFLNGLGGAQMSTNNTLISVAGGGGMVEISNRGLTNYQAGTQNNSAGYATGSALQILTANNVINTANNWNFGYSAQLATATDWLLLESFTAELFTG